MSSKVYECLRVPKGAYGCLRPFRRTLDENLKKPFFRKRAGGPSLYEGPVPRARARARAKYAVIAYS